MSRKDISTLQVLEAIEAYRATLPDMSRADVLRGVEKLERPLARLMRITGEPVKVCERAIEREEAKGFIDCGVSVYIGWLTQKGEQAVKLLREEHAHGTRDQEARADREAAANRHEGPDRVDRRDDEGMQGRRADVRGREAVQDDGRADAGDRGLPVSPDAVDERRAGLMKAVTEARADLRRVVSDLVPQDDADSVFDVHGATCDRLVAAIEALADAKVREILIIERTGGR